MHHIYYQKAWDKFARKLYSLLGTNSTYVILSARQLVQLSWYQLYLRDLGTNSTRPRLANHLTPQSPCCVELYLGTNSTPTLCIAR